MKKIIRYIGSKEKLLDFLSETIFNEYKNKKIRFLDGFSGTTVVSKYCQENYNWTQYLSDISDYSEILSSRLFLSNCTENVFKHLEILQKLEGIEGVVFNELSINGKPETISLEKFESQTVKSRMFFTEEVGQKIDAMRTYIKSLNDSGQVNDYETKLLLMFMLAFADKNANTTSIYGAYLKKQNRETKYISENFISILKKEYRTKPKAPEAFLKGDIITNLNKLEELDVVYFDPPYNTRRYESNYHILNYLSDLNFTKEKIKPESKTGLPITTQQNLFGSKKGTRTIFKDLIKTGSEKSRNVFISYSSDGEMTPEEIQDICSDNKLTLEVFTKDYKKFKAKDILTESKLTELIYHIGRD